MGRNSVSTTLFDDRPSGDGASGPVRGPEELVGTVIDERYRVEALLGKGGMGLVYRATHTRLNRAFAIKVLRYDAAMDPKAVARFQREAESASAIGNPHIVDVSDFGTLPDGSTYFVMECLQGVDLIGALDADGPMPVERACNIGIHLCRALGAAHAAGIVHRDLKPENVFLIERDGAADFVKVLDFGIAKVTHEPDRLTRQTDFLGTPHYMSPEQCGGLAIDHRTDIYALGVLLYEMVAARVPHDADTTMAILHKHVYERPTPIDLYVPRVSPAFKRIVARCLEKKPERRYQSMSELQTDLERLVSHDSESRSSFGRLPSFGDVRARMSPARFGLAAAILFAMVVALVGATRSADPADPVAPPNPSSAQPAAVTPAPASVPEALARPSLVPDPAQADALVPPPLLERALEMPEPRRTSPSNKPTRRKTSPRPKQTRAKPKETPTKSRKREVLDPWL